MNERIKEFAENAWKEILDENDISGDANTMLSPGEVFAFEQKFAELIVKECIRISDETGSSSLIGDRIAEHFGFRS